MNPLDEKSKTLSRCGSFYYHILTDASKAEAEFVSHLTSVNKLFPLGNKIITALRGDCHYSGYYKLIKFTDKQIDWNGMKAALQFRVAGGMGVPSDKMEYFSSSKARELGEQAWILKKEDVPKGIIQVAAIKMQTLNISPIKTPVYLQVFLLEGTSAPSFITASSKAITLAPGDIEEWTFDNLLLGTDIYERGGTVAFQFATSSDAGWQSENSVLYHTAVGAGAYVPAVQFWRLIAPERSLPAFNRPAQLSITDHFFMGDDKWNWLSKEGTPQSIAFPGGERDIILPEAQELIWDLHIDEHIMVTSIKIDDGTMLYANQDFASQFGKLTFLKNPIALFPKMQFMAQSYTGRMPNLYNYLVRADEVYGSIKKMMSYMRGAQSIKSLYHASAQAAGLAVIEKDCTVVAVSPLLEGKLYITTAGRYEANYPHTPLKLGTKLPKDYIIGGNQLYRLIGPYDPMPSNVAGINLGTALPVPGLIAPNKDIVITDENGNYRPDYIGDVSALKAYYDYIDAQQKQPQEPNTRENGMQHFRYTACPNRCVVACINESYMTSQMKLRLMTYLQRELPIGSVLVTANLPNTVNEVQSPIDGVEFVLEELRAGLNKLVGAGNYEVDSYDGNIVVHTDRLDDTQFAAVTNLIECIVPSSVVVERYNHNIEISYRDINKYAWCTNVADMLAVNPDYKNDLTSDGEWVYNLTNLVEGQQLFNGAKIKKWSIKIVPKVKNMFRMFYGGALIGDEFECDFPSCTNTHDLFAYTRCRVFRVSFGAYNTLAQTWYGSNAVEEIYGDFSKITKASNTFYKCLNLQILDSDWSSLSSGVGTFNECELPKSIALRVLNSIPPYASGSHPLTIGIHVDHQADEEVLAAIADAEAKGWTLTVQWNGTPTSGISTLNLEEIYAKVIESEYGDYTDENGNKCMLDWGHYVTDPTDYKIFFSIYEAEQYFKLTKIAEQV